MKGICFTEPLFNKVINGTKTQTRRIIKPQPDNSGLWNDSKFPRSLDSDLTGWNGTVEETGESREFKPRYKVGETVYLKEPYFRISEVKWYKFDDKRETEIAPYLWKGPITMPEKYARYFIKITAVRCERLRDISVEDCMKEGIFSPDNERFYNGYEKGNFFYGNARSAYAALIDKIGGKGTWASNPYVWVYEFKLLKKGFN